MIRLTYLSGSSSGKAFASERALIRIGSGSLCDLGLPSMAPRHAEIRKERGGVYLFDVSGGRGVWVNDRKISHHKLKTGDRLHFGNPESASLTCEILPGRSKVRPAARGVHLGDPEPLEHLFEGDALTTQAAEDAARRVTRARQRLGVAHGSGKTMVIFAEAMMSLRKGLEHRSGRRARRVLLALAIPVFALLGLLGAIVISQQRQIDSLVREKEAIDSEILSIHAQMQAEDDAEKLERLDERLQQLMSRASQKVAAVSSASKRRGEELLLPADELERKTRRLLRRLNAETYSVPPAFRMVLRGHVEKLRADPSLGWVRSRRDRIWPKLRGPLRRVQLPEELGYIAFTESGFDPLAHNARSGAKGMWQLMETTARSCGLRIDAEVDERTHVERSTEAAACHLSRLLIEFGEQSVLLVLASYNRGENGVRAALHRVAREPGGFKRRDFWHLYRMKLLPPETREYVPKVLAAAIVLGDGGAEGEELADARSMAGP